MGTRQPRRTSPSNWQSIVKDEYIPLKVGSIDATDTQPHDRAIIRAETSEYYPNKKVTGEARKTIFIGRLNPHSTENTLMRFFSEFGRIRKCRVVRDIVTGFSKRYAFIEYEHSADALKASERADGMIIDKEKIFVDMECERTLKGWKPRRLGGGFGGQKESGQLRFGGKARPFLRPIDAFTRKH
ncbi:U11/U12 small nuclear ribonucleoprotein 35 kDa protein-like isoform X2 [Ctenocephalides felis]|uniref:U11/U12 small nuclear ribonucleoprotein 35 kDa protein-like isoform X2 n=1 Tax=Ctenocephalides felis TaxID=7515 RepID=UPI000E6E3157|nr:U11/U12 small nuclear ribonucleoprotein 35 kDa protein-like isoform X2 [Ctenocephalides felis]